MNQKNVYELTQERLKMIFEEFDNIYISFSVFHYSRGSIDLQVFVYVK